MFQTWYTFLYLPRWHYLLFGFLPSSWGYRYFNSANKRKPTKMTQRHGIAVGLGLFIEKIFVKNIIEQYKVFSLARRNDFGRQWKYFSSRIIEFCSFSRWMLTNRHFCTIPMVISITPVEIVVVVLIFMNVIELWTNFCCIDRKLSQ